MTDSEKTAKDGSGLGLYNSSNPANRYQNSPPKSSGFYDWGFGVSHWALGAATLGREVAQRLNRADLVDKAEDVLSDWVSRWLSQSTIEGWSDQSGNDIANFLYCTETDPASMVAP